jgi:hypothetical protein
MATRRIPARPPSRWLDRKTVRPSAPRRWISLTTDPQGRACWPVRRG